MGHYRFPKAWTRHTIRYIPTVYIATIDEGLDWIGFVNFFYLIDTNVLTHEYGLHKSPKLTHF
jgi:hypothetical protein